MKAYPSILAVFALAVAARPLPAADQTIDTIAGTSEVIVLNAPRGIAVDGSGAVYVADTLNHLVRKLAFSSGWSIVAGTGAAGNTGDGGAATDAKLDEPYDVDVDASGNVYIADKKNHVVRKVDAATGIISVYAGTGTDGYSGDGAAATLADMGEPFGICFDSAGNLYIADRKKHVVRKVNAISGTISTVAGDGTIGYTGDGGDATAAQLEEPYDVAVDSFGHLYIAGRKNSVVRKVNAGTGIISTYAGTGTSGYTGDGGPATAATLAEPAGLWIDSGDNLYIADRNKHVVRKVDFSTGFISTVMGTGSSGYSGDGDVGTAAQVSAPDGVAVDADGNIYVADTGNHMLRWIDAGTGEVGTLNGAGGFGGDGGTALLAHMSQPFGVAVDDSYNYYIADKANRRVRRVDAETGIITTVAGDGTDGYSGDGGQGTDAQLGEPWDVAVDSNGDLYIADRKQHVVRKVTVATGIITTYAGNGSSGWDGDGGPATLAKMVEPSGLAFDASDNLYIADKNKHVVRKVDAATGIITTHAGNGGDGYDGDGGLATAAKLGQPHGLAVDGSGNLYIADFSRDAVRKVDAATGIISTYAGTGSAGYTGDGGLATLAKIEEPYGLAIDGNDNLYVAVKRNDVVRKVDAATGFITTVVGTGSEGHTGDGGLASLATLAEPFGLAIDREGDLYIADKKNNVIRRCDFGDPTSTIVSWTEAEP